jgi:cell division septum initiation protein DivIVA
MVCWSRGKKEKHEEQVQFAAYKQFCDDTSVEKQRAIKEANLKIDKLRADIQKFEADAARLGREIKKHDEDIATFEGDKAASTKVRQIEKADYQKTHVDYSESVDALGRAIQTLKSQNYDRKQAESMLFQLQNTVIPFEKRHLITAFLQQDPEVGLDVSAPDAHGYEFQSGGVIEMLEKLADKFEDERSALEKAESNAAHAYDMLQQDLTAQIEQNTQARTEKSAAKAKKLQAASNAKGDLGDTTATRDDDQKYLSDLTATCEQKASDFENRQQLRADELAAVEKAIEILGSGAVSGASEKHLPQLVQYTSFLQLSSKQAGVNQEKALSYIARRGRELNSRILTQLAVRAGDDPFKKVKKLIQDLIVRLMEEANEEAEHKGWCDTELATNEATRKEKTSVVETLHAEIDQLQASIAKLDADITELAASVAELDKAVSTATKIRAEETETNKQTVKDAQEAQAAVAQALEVLKEFYAKAGEAKSFMQQPDAPEIFDSPYTGMQSENGGVVGMIEVIQSDFARLEAETTASEAEAQKEHDTFLSDSAVDKAQKSKDIEHKTVKKQNSEQAAQEKKGDLEGTQKELDAALAYYDKLKPSCIDSGVSYEDRVARRQEEIESLQEALRILNGEDIA